MKAYLDSYRQSPRKVRLLADLVRGKNVEKATTLLKFADKKAADAVGKLLDSAVANAKNNFNIEKDNLTKKQFLDLQKGSNNNWVKYETNVFLGKQTHFVAKNHQQHIVATK